MEALKKEARRSIVAKLNRALQVEYDLIFNYPRMIDKLVNIDKINDERLNNAIEVLGIESLRHFTEVDNLIVKLGGEVQWRFEILDRLVDVEEILAAQLKREKWVVSWYASVKRIAEQGKASFLDRLAIGSDAVDANEIINMMDRLIRDEKRHATLVEKAVTTLKKLMNR